LGKDNYSFKKRQKELATKKKQEEKLQRKFAKRSMSVNVENIEASIHQLKALDPGQKQEINQLLSTLKSEIEALSTTHEDHARSIETHLENLSGQALSNSVKGFEESHPRLVLTINELCKMLANIGI